MIFVKWFVSLVIVALFGRVIWKALFRFHVEKEAEGLGRITSRMWIPRPAPAVLSVLGMIFVLALFNGSVGQVSAGHRGVVLQFGAVTGEVKGEGLYFITPFVQSIVMMDVQTHAHEAPAAAASKDLQNVSTKITLNYALNPGQVAETYRDLRTDYEARIIVPSVQEAVKSATAKYDAEKLIVERESVRTLIETTLRDRLSRHGIALDQISITNFEFSPEFSNAIESKVVATQNALRAENDLKRIGFEAEQRIATATAEAEAIRIQAQSIAAQGGKEYVSLKAVEKWDGVLPQWMSGGAIPFINAGEALKR